MPAGKSLLSLLLKYKSMWIYGDIRDRQISLLILSEFEWIN